jgi:hypothetical protein
MASAPWIVSHELRSRIKPLLPRVERRFRYPGRKRRSAGATRNPVRALHRFAPAIAEGPRITSAPECGSTVYWDISVAPDVIGVAVGGLTDPTFPPPMISGFEAYGHPWAMNASDLPVPHYEYDGTEHGGFTSATVARRR